MSPFTCLLLAVSISVMYVMLSQTMCMLSVFEEEKPERLDEALLAKLPI